MSRRLTELKNVQLKIAISKPSNLGLLSWLLVFLMQHVMTTPIPTKSFMNDVLMDVNFAGVIGESGMFFLKGLDMETLTVDDIDPLDPPEVKFMYKSLKARHKHLVSKRLTPAENGVSSDFPWGRVMSWSMVKILLNDQPTTFVREWAMDINWNLNSEGFAAELFITFTHDVWLSISDSFVSQPLLPRPNTLTEAMQSWSVLSVITLLGENQVNFIPSTHGLKGQLPATLKREDSFAWRRASFFPSRNQPLDKRSAWFVLANTAGGYIHKYHNFTKRSSENTVADCHRMLDAIFSHVQCLPSFQPKSKTVLLSGPIWVSTNNKVVIITNSEYYRLERVQPVTGEIHKLKRIQASALTIEARLMLQNQGIPMAQTLRNRRHQGREAKKNPKKKQSKKYHKKNEVNTEGRAKKGAQSDSSIDDSEVGDIGSST